MHLQIKQAQVEGRQVAMKLTKREEILIFIALLLACLVVMLNYVYTPISKKNSELKDKTMELAGQIDAFKVKKASVHQMKDKTGKLAKKLSTSIENVPGFFDTPQQLYDLENTLQKLCNLKNVNVYDPVDTVAISGEEIALQLRTNNNNLQKMIKALESAKYFNTLKTISVTKDSGGSDKEDKNMDLAVNMVVRFYSQNQPKNYPETYEFSDKSYGKSDIFK
jgi:Tfp pilus assembly protein PilO